MTTDRLDAIRPPVQVDDRLTVRHRLADGSATDVIGWVTAIGAEHVELSTGTDPGGVARLVRVQRDRIIVTKRVPPAKGGRAPARHTAEELQQAAIDGWRADAEDLGQWVLRWGGGFTSRANSCAAIGDPGVPYAEAAGLIIDRYQGLGLPARAQVINGSVAEEQLRGLGWTDAGTETTMMAIGLVALIGGHRRSGSVTIDNELTDAWWQAFQQYRATPEPAVAQRILTGPPPVGLASITESDRVTAIGRGQVSNDWLGLSALWTDPGHRRRGHATTIIGDLALWAARHGARNAYLQVETANTGAIDSYARLGFIEHHRYRYLSPVRRR